VYLLFEKNGGRGGRGRCVSPSRGVPACLVVGGMGGGKEDVKSRRREGGGEGGRGIHQ